ncbi:phage tail protein [Anaerotruncus sp. 1XD42-93]|jgi:hypothetical protein|uniref:phage tail protein n=1 Tax=Anaerotruncus sp. 1XD42-93 TaxID=2320853 RepID=UPI000EA40635|nr:phage tail protein [Anaerotruncus sp. 1XD42-93]NBK18417.1 hypothetical protein [Anaerotruncus sp. 1XD42-93]RKJ86509.1 hypothetical protein D7Y41_19410 [Anaerotruncus sp. 1XD22-93]
MAMIGCLGDIAFTVSSSVVRTLDNFQWSGSARYAAHQRHLGRGLLEFTGVDPDKISFDMTLSTQLGASPAREISKIAKYESKGRTLPLTIGSKAYGTYRWVITGHSVKAKTFDRRGNLSVVVVSVNLQEYARR